MLQSGPLGGLRHYGGCDMPHWWLDDNGSTERSPQAAGASEQAGGSAGSLDGESFSTAAPPASNGMPLPPIQRVAELFESLYNLERDLTGELLAELASRYGRFWCAGSFPS
jgi:hypothetical protein